MLINIGSKDLDLDPKLDPEVDSRLDPGLDPEFIYYGSGSRRPFIYGSIGPVSIFTTLVSKSSFIRKK